jgi:hypothetical protein
MLRFLLVLIGLWRAEHRPSGFKRKPQAFGGLWLGKLCYVFAELLVHMPHPEPGHANYIGMPHEYDGSHRGAFRGFFARVGKHDFNSLIEVIGV